MTPYDFIERLAQTEFASTFNPYSALCPRFDQKDSARLRKDLLLKLLRAAELSGIDSLWIGRDLGYKGGRRTGLALTDEIHMSDYAKRWGAAAEQVTIGPPIAERTAAVIWQVLKLIDERVFLWNVFPLHPHEIDNPFTNRSHNVVERRFGEEMLESLIKMLRPKKIIAVGNDAWTSAQRVTNTAETFHFRHPSYGGQNIFLEQMRDCYKLTSSISGQAPLF